VPSRINTSFPWDAFRWHIYRRSRRTLSKFWSIGTCSNSLRDTDLFWGNGYTIGMCLFLVSLGRSLARQSWPSYLHRQPRDDCRRKLVTKIGFAKPLSLFDCFAGVGLVLSDGRPLWNANVWFCLEFGFYPSPPTTQLVCVSPPPFRVRLYGEAIRISCSSTSPTSEGRLRDVCVV